MSGGELTSAVTSQQGYSLIEVLVAVLVLSVGVLGVAGLQLLSLQNNTSSMYRTQAVHSAYDIIDRARTNRGQDYAIAMDGNTPNAPNCMNQTCSASQMRNYDLQGWREALADHLPQGGGAVERVGDRMTVTVRWQDSRSANAPLLDISVSTAL